MLTVFAFVHKSSHRGVSLSSLSPSLYFAAFVVVVVVLVVVVLVVVCEPCFPSPSRFKKKKRPTRTAIRIALRFWSYL